MPRAERRNWLPGAELIRTVSFRLALLYAGLFSVSVVVLLAVVLHLTTATMRRQVDVLVEERIAALRRDAPAETSDALAAEVGRRLAPPLDGDSFFLVLDPRGRRLSGNLPAAAGRPGWSDLDVPAQASRTQLHVRARGVTLPDGGLLMVGRATALLTKAGRMLRSSLAGTIAATALLAVIGGIVLSALSLRRLERLEADLSRVMDGDITRRLPSDSRGDEVDRLARRINQMLDWLDACTQSVQHVSSDIAHDLRTPLTRLQHGLEQALISARDVDAYREAVGGAVRETERILTLFSALLRIAQIESGSRRSHFAAVGLHEIAESLHEIYAPVAAAEGRILVLGADGGGAGGAPAVLVRGDAELLTQMAVNLIENALRHTPGGARVELALRAVPPSLEVADDGWGIPPEERDHVFERFRRLDRSRHAEGCGLGLCLVAAIARLHDAEVALDENGGPPHRPGLRIAVRFPAPPLSAPLPAGEAEARARLPA